VKDGLKSGPGFYNTQLRGKKPQHSLNSFWQETEADMVLKTSSPFSLRPSGMNMDVFLQGTKPVELAHDIPRHRYFSPRFQGTVACGLRATILIHKAVAQYSEAIIAHNLHFT
jgi:hypothetical protein